MLSQPPSLFGDDIIHDSSSIPNSGPQLGWFTIGFTTFNPIISYSMLQLRKPAARLGEVFLRTKWYKGVWGQSGQNGRKITELGAVERGQLEHFWGVCTRWQLGDGGHRFPLVHRQSCMWGGDRETGIEGSHRKRHCLERSLEVYLGGVREIGREYASVSYSSTPVICWAPMWDHCGRKDKKKISCLSWGSDMWLIPSSMLCFCSTYRDGCCHWLPCYLHSCGSNRPNIICYLIL